MRSLNREDIIWCAGLFEGEGTITENKLPSGKIYPRIKVKMCDKDSVQKFADTFKIPYLIVTKDKSWQDHWKPAWYCSVTGKKAYAILVALFPWLGNRRQTRAKEVIQKWINTTGFGEAVPKKEGTTICTVCYRPIKECICGI